jgi:hypothetical protein
VPGIHARMLTIEDDARDVTVRVRELEASSVTNELAQRRVEAAALAQLGMAGVFAGSSAEGEGLGMLKLSDKTTYLRTVAMRMGLEQRGPTMLLQSRLPIKKAMHKESTAKFSAFCVKKVTTAPRGGAHDTPLTAD